MIHVTAEFRIRLFTEDNDRDVRTRLIAAIGTIGDIATGFLETSEDGIGIREEIVRHAAALPCQRPAPRLLGNIVGAIARDEDACIRPDGKDGAFILEEDKRFPDGLTGHGAMFGRAENLRSARQRTLGGARLIEDLVIELGAQDAADRIIKPLHWNLAGFHLCQRVLIEALPAVGCHVHVQTCEQGCRTVFRSAAFQLAMRIPVAHNKAVEAHAALQDIREEVMVAVDLGTVPA